MSETALRILVTGGSGFLGASLCRALRQQGHQVTGLGSKDGDLTRSDSLAALPSRHYDQIYHLAAWTQAGDYCLHHQGEQWILNQQINSNVLAWWQREQPQAKLIAMGTSCAYDPALPLREENYLTGAPIDSLYAYAMTKRMLLIGLMSLARQYGLRYLCLVPTTLYGPGYHTDGRQMHFIFDLIRKILRGKLYGEPVVLWGDGYQKRELIFVEDFVDAALAVNALCSDDLVNIGSGDELTIRDFAAAICRQADFDPGLISYDSERYVGARSKCLDIGKVQTLLPRRRVTPLDEGLRRTIAWFHTAKVI